MQRSFQNDVQDAGEIVRRTNVQLAIVGAGLFLAWAAIERGYANIDHAIESLARLNVGIRNSGTAVNAIRKDIAENIARQSNIDECLATRESGSRACAGLGDVANAQNLRNIANNAKQSLNKTEAQLRMLRAEEEIKTKKRKKKEELLKELQNNIDFDLGYGIKLPFQFKYASMFWLFVALAVLGRLIVQRAKFWRLVSTAITRLSAKDRQNLEAQLAEMPFWVQPVPMEAKDHVSREELHRILGWSAGSMWQKGLSAVILFMIAAAALRVAWMGLVASGVASSELDNSPVLGWGIAAVAATILLLVVGFIVPWTVTRESGFPRYPQKQRRLLLGAGLGAGILLLSQSSLSAVYRLKTRATDQFAKISASRQKKRSPPGSAPGPPVLKPGWYRNLRSGAAHYVWNEPPSLGKGPEQNRIRFAHGLKTLNLKPLTATFDDEALRQTGQVRRWIKSRDFHLYIDEEFRNLTAQGKSEEAISLLINAARHRAAFSGAFSVLQFMDSAASFAVRSHLRRELDLVLHLAKTLWDKEPNAKVKAELASRLSRWSRAVL